MSDNDMIRRGDALKCVGMWESLWDRTTDAIAALPADPRVEKLVDALREIASITVHSGGDIHGVDRNMWKQAFCQAQDEARAALAAWEAGE
jgi:hypothetical protein